MVSTNSLSHAEAEDACVASTASLVTIKMAQDYKAIQTLDLAAATDKLWIGDTKRHFLMKQKRLV